MAKRRDCVREQCYDNFKPDPEKHNNMMIETLYLRMLAELATNRFKWIGLPDTIDERYLELTLYRRALCVFYYDKEFGRYMALQAAQNGRINMYDNPTKFTVIGNSMVSRQLTSKECVPIWDNDLRVPSYDIALLYARRLTAAEVSLDQNILLTRRPIIIGADQTEKHSYQQVWNMTREGEPVIFGTPLLTESIGDKIMPLQLAPANIHETIMKLHAIKVNIWNDCLTWFGIKNADLTKRERMIVDEVDSNHEQVKIYRNIALSERRRAAEQINRMFDLDVHVEWNNDYHMNTNIFESEVDE